MEKHSYTFGHTSDGNICTVTWYDNGTTVVCSAEYTIVADSAEDLDSAITLNALALRSANARLFVEDAMESMDTEVIDG